MKVYNFLTSQKTGIITGFTVTGLMIIGSLIMNYWPQYYAGLSGEDIKFFFQEVHPIHIWFYVMFLAFIMYGISIFFCTLDSVVRKIRTRTRKFPLYGASIVHIGFLITLAAHLIGGIGSESGTPITVAGSWVATDDFEIKVEDFNSTSYPNGMPKRIYATMKLRRNGQEIERVLGYNNPIVLDHGAKEILLSTYGNMPESIILDVSGEAYDLRVGDAVTINGTKVYLADIFLPPRVRLPVAMFVSQGGETKNNQMYLPIGKQNRQNILGKELTFIDINTSTAVVFTVKNNPSIPLTLVAIGCFGSGMLLVIFRTAYKMVRI
ncbi:MAG: cytochrome c biogenesis protein ResB [Candidatus Scalindua sp.]|nr:cytochrome c biogenesis protein ResB [Candidatus Scalindua sp.]MDR4504882.1 cytochrome c biogenesis protein ResB [Candidatus Scalindua sp.]